VSGKQSPRANDIVQAWRILDKAERRSAFLVFGSLIVGTGLELVSLGLFMPVVSVLASDTFATDYPWLANLIGTTDELGMTIRVFGLLALVFLIKSVYVAWSVWFQRGFATKIEYRLSTHLFRSYTARPYTFHLENNSSVLIRNIGMAGQFVTLTIDSLLVLGTDGAVLIAIVIFLVVIEPVGTIVVVIVLGITAVCFHMITRTRIQNWGSRRVIHEGRKIQYLQEGFGAIKEIKVLAREDEFISRFDSEVAQTTKINRGYGTLTALPRIWLEFLTLLGLAVLVTVLVSQGRQLSETLPILGVFAAGSFKVMPSMNRIIFAVQNFRYSRSILTTLATDLDLSVERIDRARSLRHSLTSAIEFRDVHYSYPTSEVEAVSGLSFTVRAGDSVGFVGSSGAGKSTLVDLLLGLLRPSMGHVLFDGKAHGGAEAGISCTIGYVPQTIYLTDDSIRHNVAFGVPEGDIDEDQLHEAIRQASLTEFVNQLPEGLDTPLGERGVRLSGGQRQRIGIARALYLDPSVLVLDEATSSLDILTEEQIVREIAAMKGSRTLIIVAHRFTSVSLCNLVYQVEYGRIVRSGSAAEVIKAIESRQIREN
jgi:ABC-type bacteriocin/lantibiotic exporter with double-glycine peptidase domain